MRILLITHAYPPESTGGVETYVRDLGAALAAAGDEVTILAREATVHAPELRLRRDREGAVSVIRVNNTFKDCRSFEDGYRHPRLLTVVEPVLDAAAPDVVHVHHLTCLSTDLVAACRARRWPVVMTLHDYWLMCHRGQRFNRRFEVCTGAVAGRCADCLEPAAAVGEGAPLALRRLVRGRPWLERAARFAAGVSARAATRSYPGQADYTRRTVHMRGVAAGVHRFLAPSASLAADFVAWGLPGSRVTFHGYGVDIPPRSASAAAREGPLRAGFVGSLLPSKAPHVLLEAARAIGAGGVTVDVAGAAVAYHHDSRYLARLQPLMSAPGVTPHGVLDKAAVRALMDRLDVIVVPSVWPENSPLVIREAFAAGLPVVASRIGGIPELVRDGVDGLLVPAGDVDALAQVLRRLHADRPLLARLASHVRPPLDIASDAGRTREIYAEVIGERRLADGPGGVSR
jgi:glycosyltransferase involved in cell wall biosynthesis